MQMTSMTYRGYAVQSFAHRLSDGYFSSNLLLEKSPAHAEEALYRFYGLDYFSTEEEAVHYSSCWARNWIDTCG
ncbi:hypothetical protein WS70_24605 [Burkholderia mayonis]|uniref:Transcriptional regulator n=2 Tax=Burkholderiaceae TaxID=119060 RepID=A0A1B4FMN7_9BURK|nr:hypothetical protein WS70_24605 [Burkholderia mayonis]KVE40484.1 hypothetical protein WS69_06325 [Burkholderia sp. BDU5]KVE41538.1 hypothetical protein WS70_13930 [Burkholderia mayonis]